MSEKQTTIAPGSSPITLINVFTVEPKNQERLVQLLNEATRTVMCKLPGFVSANIHRSLDGTRLANYAQWRSREDFEAMLQNPKALEHMAAIRDLGTNDAHLYEVVDVHPA